MSTDYSALLLEYPAVISKDQLYRICHISKRKATWLLENGIIPCRDSGKKTRRFQIYTADVVNYLITLENEPQKVAIPVGIFTSNKYRKKRENPVFRRLLDAGWPADTPVLVVSQAGTPDQRASDHEVATLAAASLLHAGRPAIATGGAGARPVLAADGRSPHAATMPHTAAAGHPAA